MAMTGTSRRSPGRRWRFWRPSSGRQAIFSPGRASIGCAAAPTRNAAGCSSTTAAPASGAGARCQRAATAPRPGGTITRARKTLEVEMTSLTRRAFAGLVCLFLVMAVLLFGPPWTFDYWQDWAFLAVYFAAALALTLYLAKEDPKLLGRRMRGGPWAEQRLMLLGAPIALGSWWSVLGLL